MNYHLDLRGTIGLFFELTWDDGQLIIGGAIGMIVLLGALAAATKSIKSEFYQPLTDRLRPMFSRRQLLNTIVSSMDELKGQVERIVAEMQVNGGTSLRDAVNRIDKNVEYASSKLRHTDDMSDRAIFETDEKVNVIYVNHSMCELMCCDQQELLLKRWMSRVMPEDREHLQREWDNSIRNKCNLDTMCRVFIQGDRSIQIRVRANPRLSRDGDLRGFFGTADLVSSL